ncbi:MAG: hypothetical protein ACXWJG_13460 [Caldimonas sp.]
MTTRSFLRRWLAGIAFAFAPALVFAQESGVRLLVQAERSVVELGEPVYLAARLSNTGPKAVRLMPLLDPKDGLLTVSVRDERGRGVGFMPWSVRDRDTPPSELGPGRQFAASFPIFFGATGWVFQAPGSYTVRARFDLHVGEGAPVTLEAEPVVIQVREGDARLRRLVSGDEASLQAGRFLDWRGGDQLTEGRALLEQLAEALPEAAVADHYHLAAGRSWVRPFKDYRVGKVRPADPARALAELDRVRDDRIPSPVRVEKYLARATALQSLGRSGEAAQALDRARALVSERAELAPYVEPLERLQRVVRPR